MGLVKNNYVYNFERQTMCNKTNQDKVFPIPLGLDTEVLASTKCRWCYQPGVDTASIPYAPQMTVGALKLRYNIDVI